MRTTSFLFALPLVLAACGSTATPATPATPAAAGSSGGAAATASAARFSVAAGAFEPDATRPMVRVPLTLAADGTVRSPQEPFGRFDGDRFVLPNGQELFRVAADGSVAMPWQRADQGLALRFTAAGLEATLPSGTRTVTIDAAGAYHNSADENTARFTPYAPALRDTALMLPMIPMLALMRGIAQQPAAPAAP